MLQKNKTNNRKTSITHSSFLSSCICYTRKCQNQSFHHLWVIVGYLISLSYSASVCPLVLSSCAWIKYWRFPLHRCLIYKMLFHNLSVFVILHESYIWLLWELCMRMIRTRNNSITHNTPCFSCSCWHYWCHPLVSPLQPFHLTGLNCKCSCGSHPHGTILRHGCGICTWRREEWECKVRQRRRCRPPCLWYCWTHGKPLTDQDSSSPRGL